MFGDSPQEIYINYDNSTHTTLNVSYSDVEGGEADIDAVDGENIIWSDTNIDLRPLLDNDYRPIYTEEVQSSCVDTGDPLMGWDADNTPPDMGAITAERPITDEWILPSVDTDNGWKWMSFPVLDKHSYIEDGAENLVYDGDMAEYMLNWRDLLNTEGSPLDFVKWCIDGVEDKIYTYNDYWENLSHIFTSVQGYKIKMNGNEPFELPVVGFLQDPETEIELNADCENWVGYFLEDSQSPQDAFSDVWRHISMLKTQHWIMVNVGNGYWFSNTKRPVLNYGDMVIVNTNADCSFRWVDIEEVSPFENPAIEHFSYQELSDYAPVVIEGLEDYENIDEIGMFINDECVGAEKVEESPMALKGYVGNKPLTNITFETHPKDTGLGKNAQHEIVNTKYEVMYYERKDGYITVNLRREYSDNTLLPSTYKLHQAYPNPFNPKTTINYQLPASCSVLLAIYNVNGQLVEYLVDSREELGGYHEVVWDATNYPSGVYFVKLVAGGFTDNQKIMLVK